MSWESSSVFYRGNILAKHTLLHVLQVSLCGQVAHLHVTLRYRDSRMSCLLTWWKQFWPFIKPLSTYGHVTVWLTRVYMCVCKGNGLRARWSRCDSDKDRESRGQRGSVHETIKWKLKVWYFFYKLCIVYCKMSHYIVICGACGHLFSNTIE